jgi:hypothetical protein
VTGTLTTSRNVQGWRWKVCARGINGARKIDARIDLGCASVASEAVLAFALKRAILINTEPIVLTRSVSAVIEAVDHATSGRQGALLIGLSIVTVCAKAVCALRVVYNTIRAVFFVVLVTS